MLVEIAKPEDVAAILALASAAPGAPRWTENAYRSIVLAAAGSPATAGSIERCLLVARVNQGVAGFAVGKLLDDEAELESVAVQASERRGGIGRALCAAVIAWAWEGQARQVELEVRASSHGAIALYLGLGFKHAGWRPRYYAAPEEDAILMRLERPAYDRGRHLIME